MPPFRCVNSTKIANSEDGMIQIPLNRVKDDLSRYLRMAEKEDVIITHHGIPAGILIGFEDPEAWW
jgi:prevent-host-death family protein